MREWDDLSFIHRTSTGKRGTKKRWAEAPVLPPSNHQIKGCGGIYKINNHPDRPEIHHQIRRHESTIQRYEDWSDFGMIADGDAKQYEMDGVSPILLTPAAIFRTRERRNGGARLWRIARCVAEITRKQGLIDRPMRYWGFKGEQCAWIELVLYRY